LYCKLNKKKIMSRIGQAPIAVPAGVEVAISGDSVTVKEN